MGGGGGECGFCTFIKIPEAQCGLRSAKIQNCVPDPGQDDDVCFFLKCTMRKSKLGGTGTNFLFCKNFLIFFCFKNGVTYLLKLKKKDSGTRSGSGTF